MMKILHKKQTLFIIVVACSVLIGSGCTESLTDEELQQLRFWSNFSDNVKDFVKNSELPKYSGGLLCGGPKNGQEPTPYLIIAVPEQSVEVFVVTYGFGTDIDECDISEAVGIRHNEKIGFIYVRNIDPSFDINNIQMYDFDSNDEYLFSGHFVDKLEYYDYGYYINFLNLLAKDEDTPEETLLNISQELNSSLIDDYKFYDPLSRVAFSLLKNQKVQTNKQILTQIKNLSPPSNRSIQYENYPAFTAKYERAKDDYRKVVTEAQKLLNGLQ